ncbi:MAG: hypothetical protein ABL993_10390 [Vicinamibacterales bacterium]
MRVLIAALHNGYYRNLESVVDELARRGHQIFLGSERPVSALGGQSIVERLAEAHKGVSHGTVRWREQRTRFLATKVRLALDYLRYLEPAYADASSLRQRAVVRTPVGLVWLVERGPGRPPAVRRLIARALDSIDRALPPSPDIERFLDEQRPDAVIITPLIGLVPSSQLDLLRSAQARGIPTAVCVWSWDHLSSKAIIRDAPDRLFVWNDTQKNEAMTMHGIEAERIIVTGAQNFDRWFGRQPSRSRAAFAGDVGLPDDRPFVLWVCSALFPGSPSEAEFVMRWAAHLRASADPRVRDVNILIRPHPSRGKEWEQVDWRRLGRVAFRGGNPIDAESRADYFDSLHHSAAVVGLNTSAFIEAGIVGRPVMTILPEEFRANQEGTLHFGYLMNVGGGLLTSARTLEDHERQLVEMLAGPPEAVLERQRRFVTAFVRPHGLDVSATTLMVEAVEALGASAPVRLSRGVGAGARLGLRALRAIERVPAGRRLLLDEREVRAKKRRAAEEHRAVSWG